MKKIIFFISIITIFFECTMLPANNVLDGKYIGNKDYGEYIYFYDKNRFYYSINVCDGFGFAQGRYEINLNRIVCFIEKKQLAGTADENLQEFIIQQDSDKSLIFKTDIGCDFHKNKVFKKGPIRYLKVKVNNLRLREYADTNSKIIQYLKKEEYVAVLEELDEEILNDKKGRWVLVKTGSNNFGYCFSAYLE